MIEERARLPERSSISPGFQLLLIAASADHRGAGWQRSLSPAPSPTRCWLCRLAVSIFPDIAAHRVVAVMSRRMPHASGREGGMLQIAFPVALGASHRGAAGWPRAEADAVESLARRSIPRQSRTVRSWPHKRRRRQARSRAILARSHVIEAALRATSARGQPSPWRFHPARGPYKCSCCDADDAS